MVDLRARQCFERTSNNDGQTPRDERRLDGAKSTATTVSFTRGTEDEDHRVHEAEFR